MIYLFIFLYLIPLVILWKRGYDETEGMLILLGLIPVINLLFVSIILIVEGSEFLIRKLKGEWL